MTSEENEKESVGGGLGALGLWIFVAAMPVIGIWDTIRKREAQHETLRRIIESGQEIDDALMDKLLGTNKRLDRDLRVSGLIVVSVAPGLAVLGWFVSLLSLPWLLPMLGVSALVLFVGIGLLVATKFAGTSYPEDGAPTSNRTMAK